MSIEQDYIMRMITMLASFLARALFQKKPHEYPEVLLEMNSFARRTLGLDLEIAHQFSDEQLIQLFASDDRLAGSKCYVLGMLLKEEAQLLRAGGGVAGFDAEKAVPLERKALRLLLAAMQHFDLHNVEGHPEAIMELAGRTGIHDLPDPLASELANFYEYTGRFGKAEDVHCDILDRDPGHLTAIADFYHRLRAKTDPELAAGDLPREEVEEGMARLKNFPQPPTPLA